MKTPKVLLAMGMAGGLMMSCQPNYEPKPYNEGVHVVPIPKELKAQPGYFTLNENTTFSLSADSLSTIYNFFQPIMEKSTGHSFAMDDQSQKNVIRLEVDPSMQTGPEGYEMSVTTTGVRIKAQTKRGAYYGMQTLMQLLPAEIVSPRKVHDIAWQAPCVTISDSPRFPYRGVMLDVCRHFHDIDFVKRQIDVLAMFKMNYFHWHLTEDHLWTIEIKKYPELTEKGSIRKEPDGSTHQGFYTQEEIKEVVAYAQERYVTIIPEIELPGHALAALTVKPELSCAGGPFELRNRWGVEEDVYCAGNEETFAFLTDVINEVSALFPGEYLHIGGDECPKTKWEDCPKCQKRIRDEKLKNEHELQSYFIKRIEKVVNANGKKMIGWDEILEGGLAPSATVMSWRGEQGGIAAANMGHDVIMTPGNWLYLDHGQGAVEVEPTTIAFATPLSETYSYDPASKKIPDSLQHHVLGAQGNMWTEYAVNPELTEYMLYPRVLAIAELTWSPATKKNFDNFLQRLPNELVRLDLLGVNYHIPIPTGPLSDEIAMVDSVTLEFENMHNLPMVYRLSDQDEFMPYKAPLSFYDDATLEIASVLPSGKKSRVREIVIDKENYMPALDVANLQPGVMLSYAPGEFFYLRDLKDAKWEKAKKMEDMKIKSSEFDRGAYIQKGYFEVPEDGVYYFSTQMDNLKVDGKDILTHDGKLVRHTQSRTSLPLAKGVHSYEVIMVNSSVGGFPRAWSPKGFVIAGEDGKFKQPQSMVE